MIVNDLQIREAPLDPGRNACQQSISVFVAVADHHASNYRGAMRVLVINFGSRDIVGTMERREQRFQPTALFLQGNAAWQVKLESQGVDMHRALYALSPVRM